MAVGDPCQCGCGVCTNRQYVAGSTNCFQCDRGQCDSGPDDRSWS